MFLREIRIDRVVVLLEGLRLRQQRQAARARLREDAAEQVAQEEAPGQSQRHVGVRRVRLQEGRRGAEPADRLQLSFGQKAAAAVLSAERESGGEYEGLLLRQQDEGSRQYVS